MLQNPILRAGIIVEDVGDGVVIVGEEDCCKKTSELIGYL